MHWKQETDHFKGWVTLQYNNLEYSNFFIAQQRIAVSISYSMILMVSIAIKANWMARPNAEITPQESRFLKIGTIV